MLSSTINGGNPRELALDKELVLRLVIGTIIQSTNADNLNVVLQLVTSSGPRYQNFKDTID